MYIRLSMGFNFFQILFFLIFQKHFLKNSQIRELYNKATKQEQIQNTKHKGDMTMSKFTEVNDKIAEKVVEGYKKIENGVVSGYKKIESGAVTGFNKVNDKIIEKVFSKDGESVEDTKKRLSNKK